MVVLDMNDVPSIQDQGPLMVKMSMRDQDIVGFLNIIKLKISLHQPGLLKPGVMKNRNAMSLKSECCSSLTL